VRPPEEEAGAPAGVRTAHRVSEHAREVITTFGPGGALVGVLTEPVRPRGDRLTALMWNVGLNHRVGPSRAWVELSRRLAAEGVHALRFDVGGLGDSAPRPGPAGELERAVLDLEDAIAWVEANVGGTCVLVSNCSGTDNAHAVAARDPRVRAAVFLDGYTYPTARYHLHGRVLRFVTPRRWGRFLRRHVPGAFGLRPDRAGEAGDEIYVREYPPRDRFAADVAAMVGRGARLLYVFSGETSYAYAGQFDDWMGRRDWRGAVEVAYDPEANHTYSYRPARERMLARVTRWVAALPPTAG
jgi:hypothetical protein